MSDTPTGLDRREFFKAAGAGVAAAGLALGPAGPKDPAFVVSAQTQSPAEKARLDRIASCSYPIRSIFKTRTNAGRGPNPATQQLKQQYGEITMLDFPQF